MNKQTQDKKQFLLIGLITLIISACWIPYLQTIFFNISFGDEGYVVESARRIYVGQIPYKDFFTAITPGSYYWSALFMKLFGPSFLSVRIGTLATSAIILACCCLILNRLRVHSCLPYLIVAAYLAYFGGPYWFIASHHWLALATSLISLYFLLAPTNDENAMYQYVLAGIMASVTAFTMQHLGGVWILGAMFCFFFTQGVQRKKQAAAFFAGVLFFAIPLVISFLSVIDLNTLIYNLIIYPLTRYHEITGHHSFNLGYIGEIWNGVKSAWQVQENLVNFTRATTISLVFVGLLVLYALPFAGILALLFLWREKRYSQTNLLFLTAFFFTQYLTVLNRISDQALAFAAPAAILIILLAFTSTRSNYESKPVIRWCLSVTLIFFSTTFISALSYHILVPKLQTLTPAGPIYTTSPAEYQTLQGLNSFFTQRKVSTESVFCYPYSPMIYFLFKTDNPTSHDTLVHPMATVKQHDEARQSMENSKNRWVIVTSKIDGDPFEKYLFETYRPVIQLPYAMIMERKQL